jgi:hypothetical protein
MTASARQRSQASAAFAEASYRPAIVRSRICNRCDDQQSTMLRRARRGGGRNARATSRAVRVSGSFPQQSTLANCRLPLALPQSSSKVRNSHVSLHTLSSNS